eukprot:CAMPEP_0114341292 /NCGR_PEP_ID=MMETSP0101-20121206/8951_1 /TAXON_ID=38822 ORGANISM="Pteridomonas danica, Strain PT" /NCGR_SAMPLE_ID=MMETSP0101 /ASSEMBLY_ACC=CAM_ASM_000211 /LENGTH=45 /DNA_ID= /DNA_START= /DNA_END= /DNA_ORIENTATION=
MVQNIPIMSASQEDEDFMKLLEEDTGDIRPPDKHCIVSKLKEVQS